MSTSENPERLYVTYFCVSGPQTEAYLADGPDGHEGCPVVAEYVLASVADAAATGARADGKREGIAFCERECQEADDKVEALRRERDALLAEKAEVIRRSQVIAALLTHVVESAPFARGVLLKRLEEIEPDEVARESLAAQAAKGVG